MKKDFSQLYDLVEKITQEEHDFIEKQKAKKNGENLPDYFVLYTNVRNATNDKFSKENAEKIIKKELKNNDFPTLCRDTGEKILDFLDKFYTEKENDRKKVRKLLDRCEYLINKELFDLAEETWQEAKEIAQEKQIYDEYTRLFHLKIQFQFKNNFRDNPKIAREFAEIIFQVCGTWQSKKSSIEQFGNKEMNISDFYTNFTNEYKKAIKTLEKTQKTTIQEEILNGVIPVLEYNIKDMLAEKGFILTKPEHQNFYANWFFRLISLFLNLNQQSEKYHHLIDDYLQNFIENPDLFSSSENNFDEQSKIWDNVNNSWQIAWQSLMYFEQFYFAFQQGYYERAYHSLQKMKNTIIFSAFNNSIKYSAFGYFLARKTASLELITKLKSGEKLENVKNIVNTFPQDLGIFSEMEVQKTALRYEFNLIILRFLSCYGNQQSDERGNLTSQINNLLKDEETFERENLTGQINDLLKDKKTLKDFPHYEADIRLMKLLLETWKQYKEIESVIKKTGDFLKKNNLYKDFRETYFEFLRKSNNKKKTIEECFKEKKELLKQQQEPLNPFHFALIEIFSLSMQP